MLRIFGKKYGIDDKLLKKAAKEAFEYLGGDFEVNLRFVSEDQIQKLNRAYRNIDEVTDVLSFKTDSEVYGGDIAICYNELKTDAENLWKLPISEAAAFLMVHGMLHLANFDHMSSKDRAKMVGAEDEILGKLQINVAR
jgi:probable rRNA maturation factor